MRWPVDDFLKEVAMNHIRVMDLQAMVRMGTAAAADGKKADGDGPEVNDSKEREECEFVHREEVRVDVIGQRLEVAVQWVKGMRRPWCWDCKGSLMLSDASNWGNSSLIHR